MDLSGRNSKDLVIKTPDWRDHLGGPFTIFRFTIIISLQWFSLVLLCDTKGGSGLGTFLIGILLISVFESEVSDKRNYYRNVVIISYFLMMIYYVMNQW